MSVRNIILYLNIFTLGCYACPVILEPYTLLSSRQNASETTFDRDTSAIDWVIRAEFVKKMNVENWVINSL